MRADVDVVIVGAGISGIGAAYHLSTNCPDRTFTVLEGRQSIGGTWDLFRYPGIRSDSDMHTLGYRFKPWTAEKSIADGPAIMDYLNETVDQFDVRRHIRFGHHVERAAWSSADALWTLTGQADGQPFTITCRVLAMCSGYYNYRHGHRPEFVGEADFAGTIVHPQHWPEDLDYVGKRVVVIGSGATAMTLVPAMAATARHVTMIQRSPTYVVARPAKDQLANGLRRVLPNRLAYAITRGKNTVLQQMVYKRARTKPDEVKDRLLTMVRDELGPDYDVDTHFTPSYNPWEQRLCLVPDGDLFQAIRDGSVTVVTDRIERFTATGLRTASGQDVPADIIVTATGLDLVTLGEVAFDVDGQTVDFAQTWTYKGLAYSDVPNLVSTFGYINASWTLRADLISEYLCRLLNHMRETGTDVFVARLRPSDRDMPQRAWIEDFSAGYMRRAMHLMPKHGDRQPWINPQNYAADKKMFRKSPLSDGAMRFEPRGQSGGQPAGQ
ncbi:MAG TPA: NAD(P)/FAD-dependent oxidoreductase [Ilumatobacteraceae bacterium]|nr:NAD(P)/FAD-dependent oxidoreductase [Ilumatobacteraceae bacterium]